MVHQVHNPQGQAMKKSYYVRHPASLWLTPYTVGFFLLFMFVVISLIV